MPNLGPLNGLRARLLDAMGPQKIFHAPTWGNPRVMTEALRSVKRDLGGNDGGPPADDLLRTSLQKFVKTRQVANFTELKYVCYGVTVPVGQDQCRIIDMQPLFDDLLNLVKEREVQPKQFRRCYQGLLTGYFGFDREAKAGVSAARNWKHLRGYLNERLSPILKASAERGTSPDWLQTLNIHQNLLTDDPCSRYADGLSRGYTAELKEVCAGLGIAGSSWVWQDALMAYVRLTCAGNDTEFRNGLMGVLNLVNGRADLKLPSTLSTTATALSVTRYSKSADKPENADLRDSCVQWIGNPWLKRTAWDAQVNYEPARQMVDGWLKRRLIQDFFELLAQDGSADLRRLNYWLNWAPQITDMWFVLGSDARENRSAAFMELRKRMSGRDRVLTDNNHQNNAFVMRIGPLLVIEFGVTGNACYAFAASDFRTSLERPTFGIAELKQRALATRLSHMSQWESRFDYEFKRLLQSVPMSKGDLRSPEQTSNRPAVRQSEVKESIDWDEHWKLALSPAAKSLSGALPKPKTGGLATPTASAPKISPATLRRGFSEADFDTIRTLCVQNDVECEDNRAKKGALWVLISDRKKQHGFSSLLDRYGFRYTEGKGFWLKDED